MICQEGVCNIYSPVVLSFPFFTLAWCAVLDAKELGTLLHVRNPHACGEPSNCTCLLAYPHDETRQTAALLNFLCTVADDKQLLTLAPDGSLCYVENLRGAVIDF